MKKVIAILTALVLALGLGCTFAMAEDDSVPPSTPEMKAYESAWISEDGQTLVWIGRQDEGFQIEAVQMTGENTRMSSSKARPRTMSRQASPSARMGS